MIQAIVNVSTPGDIIPMMLAANDTLENCCSLPNKFGEVRGRSQHTRPKSTPAKVI